MDDGINRRFITHRIRSREESREVRPPDRKVYDADSDIRVDSTPLLTRHRNSKPQPLVLMTHFLPMQVHAILTSEYKASEISEMETFLPLQTSYYKLPS